MILEKKLIEKIIKEASKSGADFVEVFAENTTDKVISMMDSKVNTIEESHVRGVGLRVALGTNFVYGYSNNIDEDSLLSLADKLSASFNDEPKDITPLKPLKIGDKHKCKIYPKDVKTEDKIKILEKSDKIVRAYAKEIIQARIVILETNQLVEIANSEGTYIQDERNHLRFTTIAIASNGTTIENGHASVGKNMGYEMFDSICDVEALSIEAAKQAIVNLNAKPCPSGEMPVIIGKGFGGVLFHEAVGHSLEATSVAKNLSVFCGKLNTKVAYPCVSAFDDGTIENDWGSATFDDEGNPQQKRQLIKDGVLVSYMVDKLNGKKMGANSTGSGRRESYKYAPTSRMSNTFIANGTSTLEEMLVGIERGLYCKSLGGGSVDPFTGDFNFAVSEAYLIKDGKICEPVRGASLVGKGIETLSNIVMVGNDLESSPGMCGSLSGSIPANCGQPTIKVSKMVVGGTEA